MSLTTPDRKYEAPSIVELAEGLENLEEVDERDLALLVHMGMLYTRKKAVEVREFLRAKKRSYDSSGESSKTPFSLRNFTDPKEREWILSNVAFLSSVHGCTGGCTWCNFSAFLTKDIEATPLEQQIHLWDEILATRKTGTGVKSPAAILPYYDNDPLDDPSILQVLEHFQKASGGKKLYVSTVIPTWKGESGRGEAAFELLARNIALSRKRLDVRGPLPSDLRVSEVRHRSAKVEAYDGRDELEFDRSPRDVPGGSRISAGAEFFRSGEKVGKYGIMCRHGMIITPFGVFNAVGGKITREFPNGHTMVPFKGFLEEPINGIGRGFSEVLQNVIVLMSHFFDGSLGGRKEGIAKGPKHILIYDGQDVREIEFDHETYEILQDRIVQTNVFQPGDLKADYIRSFSGREDRHTVSKIHLRFTDLERLESYPGKKEKSEKALENTAFITSLRKLISEAVRRGVEVSMQSAQISGKIGAALGLDRAAIKPVESDEALGEGSFTFEFCFEDDPPGGNYVGLEHRKEGSNVQKVEIGLVEPPPVPLVWLPYEVDGKPVNEFVIPY